MLLLLEDLRGARPGDILVGASAAAAAAMFSALGRLHARPAPAAWPDHPPRWRGDTPAHVPAFLARYPHPWARARLPHLAAAVAAHAPALAAQPRAIIHADAHLDNWMFRPAPVLIDWETARSGPPIIDAARLLLEGVHAGVRRAAGGALLAAWGHDPSGLRAAVWYSLNAMIPHHATADLDQMPARMARVHRHCAQQALALAADLDL